MAASAGLALVSAFLGLLLGSGCAPRRPVASETPVAGSSGGAEGGAGAQPAPSPSSTSAPPAPGPGGGTSGSQGEPREAGDWAPLAVASIGPVELARLPERPPPLDVRLDDARFEGELSSPGYLAGYAWRNSEALAALEPWPRLHSWTEWSIPAAPGQDLVFSLRGPPVIPAAIRVELYGARVVPGYPLGAWDVRVALPETTTHAATCAVVGEECLEWTWSVSAAPWGSASG